MLEDTSGSIEMLVFPKVLTQYSHKLAEGSVVIVRGRVSTVSYTHLRRGAARQTIQMIFQEAL